MHLALEVADRAYVLSHGNLTMQGDAAHFRKNSHLLKSSYLGGAALDDSPTTQPA